MLIADGALSVVVNLLGGFVFFVSAKPRRRHAFRRVLFAYCVGSMVMCVVLLAAGIMCFSRLAGIEDALDGEIRKIMQTYRDGAKAKLTMDKLQMQYSCCGNDNYTDWFEVPWIREDFLNVQSDDVARWACNILLINK